MSMGVVVVENEESAWINVVKSVNSLENLNEVISLSSMGERGGSVVECRTPEREVRGSRPTVAVLCP